MGQGREKKLRRSHAILSREVEASALALEPELESALKSTSVVDQAETKADAETAIEQTTTGEIGGPKGPEPTRFGDWERKGRCIDF